MTPERGARADDRGPAAGAVPALVEPGAPLSPADLDRFARHVLLPALGELGQRRLRNARVCVVGAGGLGSPVLLQLAAAGVGTIGIVDPDSVELSNLHRQVVHGVADLGRLKVVSAAESVTAIDPGIVVVTHALRLTAATASLLGDDDLVVDGTDSFESRYLVNDACVRLGLPEVWGSVLRFDAQVSVFWGRPPPGSGVEPVQLRDLFPHPPDAGSVPSCTDAGVLGALCGQVGALMATEAIKLISGVGRLLLGRVLVLDALEQRWSELPLVAAASAGEASAGEASARGAGGPRNGPVPTISAVALAAVLEAATGRERTVTVVDVREAAERLAGRGDLGRRERLMTGEQRMRSVAEHVAGALVLVGPVPAAEAPLDEALGGLLTLDVVAGADQPRWDSSSMDGYAVRSADTVGAALSPVRLSVIADLSAEGVTGAWAASATSSPDGRAPTRAPPRRGSRRRGSRASTSAAPS